MIKNILLYLTCTFVFLLSSISVSAQTINSAKGYSTQIGNVVSMLEDLKGRVTNSVVNLNQSETDFLLDKDANRIGALILHLAATEKYYQVYTFENRGFNREEQENWALALDLGDKARETIKTNPWNITLKFGVMCAKKLCGY